MYSIGYMVVNFINRNSHVVHNKFVDFLFFFFYKIGLCFACDYTMTIKNEIWLTLQLDLIFLKS